MLEHELTLKYQKKQALEKLYFERTMDEWTFYLSLKRRMEKTEKLLQM